MTVSISVTLVCDRRAARAPGCQWSHDLGADPAPAAVAAEWRHAAGLGWTAVRSGGAVGHLCPSCNGARLAGEDVRPRPAAPALPRNIGEATERDRRREA